MDENTAENLNAGSAADMLLVVSKVKRHIKDSGELNSSQDFFDQLNRKVVELIKQAVAHAKEDKRKTVMGRDIV